MEHLHNARTDLSCKHCMHRMVCSNKEKYAIFLDETMRKPFDLMPDFLDMYVSCKYFREDYLTPRSTSSYWAINMNPNSPEYNKPISENNGGNHA